MKILFFILFSFSSSLALASNTIELCLRDCENKIPVSVSPEAEKKLQALFENPQMDATEERRCIGKAIALIEQDIYQRITKKVPGFTLDNKLRERLSNKDQTRNTRQFLRYLLDQGYIHQHILRRTEKRSLWLGADEYTSVIQSISPHQIFAVDSTNSALGEEPIIVDINTWRKEQTLQGIQYQPKKITPKASAQKDTEIDYEFQ